MCAFFTLPFSYPRTTSGRGSSFCLSISLSTHRAFSPRPCSVHSKCNARTPTVKDTHNLTDSSSAALFYPIRIFTPPGFKEGRCSRNAEVKIDIMLV